MKLKNLLIIVTAAASISFVGCKDQGPVQEAGDAVSDAAGKTSDAVKEGAKKTGEAAEDAYDATKDAVEKGVEKVEEGAKKAGEAVKDAVK